MIPANPSITVRAAAERLKRSESGIDKIARAHGVGKLVTARLRLFTDEDISTLETIIAQIPRRGRRKKTKRI